MQRKSQQELNDLRAQLAAMQAAGAGQDALNQELLQLQDALRRLQQENGGLKAQVTGLEAASVDAQTNAAKARELDGLKEDLDTMRQQLEKERKMKNSYVCVAAEGERQMRARINELEEALRVAQHEVCSAASQLAALKGENADLQASLQDSHANAADNEVRVGQVQSLKHELAMANKLLDETSEERDKLRRLLGKCQDELAGIEAQLVSSRLDNSKLEAAASRGDEKGSRLQQDKDALQAELDALRRVQCKEQAAAGSVQHELAATITERDVLRTQLEDLNSNCRTMSQELARLRPELEEASEKIVQLTKRVNELEGEKTALAALRDVLQAELETAQDGADVLRNQLRKCELEVSRLQGLVEAGDTETGRLREALKAAEDTAKKMVTEFAARLEAQEAAAMNALNNRDLATGQAELELQTELEAVRRELKISLDEAMHVRMEERANCMASFREALHDKKAAPRAQAQIRPRGWH
eukprot:TRINITY_DN32966_c0_g1_i1.p1 TRINITY_DN32966_c0_g1~~TRINITY_DN32966_c0_g1_i1.p1  ORF type:complete len:475 (-),score=155.62 TRINITY_DN32966_c0_g1_i1:175-1599(-)